MCKYELNDKLNYIEIYFDKPPILSIRNEIKANGFKWNSSKKCWYATQSFERIRLAKKLSTKRYCYAASVKEFMAIDEDSWKKEMKNAFKENIQLPLSASQIEAWNDCFTVLKKELTNNLFNCNIIFEYFLPYENGRRPDVLLVSDKVVIVLEFKRKSKILSEDLDQVIDYSRDIREYHYESRNKIVIPMLVLTKTTNINSINKEVHICSADNIMTNINKIISNIGTMAPCDIEIWTNSKYEPLPTIVEAARNFWNNNELPNIKHAHTGTNLDEANTCLKKITKEAEKNKKNILALVTGVPGSGKTFLGLQFVYDEYEMKNKQNSIFLSGNGPLIEVLQDILKGEKDTLRGKINKNNFITNVNKIIGEFINRKPINFNNNIIVFDEGQRTWNSQRMTKFYHKKNDEKTEADVLIQLCDEKLEWCVFLILVGEGQEINSGENGGIVQWYNAITNSNKNWDVVCPNKLANIFKDINVQTYDVLDLKVSIRSHTAAEVSNFINKFISGNIDEAAKLIDKIPQEDFHMYYTKNLERAKNYCKNKYEKQPKKRYGMLVSSKDRSLKKLGILQPTWSSKDNKKVYPNNQNKKWKVAPWFNETPNHQDSSCALNIAITEFDCQGLEIDMPIIIWGDDAKWINGNWKFSGNNNEMITYRNNSYRVLLTRGREGFIVYIPEGRNDIIDIFNQVGIKELKD
mgnify:CR=1 FL=1